MMNPRTEETSTEIRRAALEMFVTRGYDSTSVRDIAAAVGIRGASIYHHFTSKEDVLWDLTRTALARLAESWHLARNALESDDPLDVLRAFVRANVRFHASYRTEARLINAQLQRLSDEHYRQAVELRYAYETELMSIVQACVATGRHEVPDVRVTVFAILQMTMAVASWYDPTGPLTIDRLATVYEQLAVKLLA